MKIDQKIGVLLILAFLGLVITTLIPCFGQDPKIHQLADQRTLITIPYFSDVVSNLGFLFVGILGLRWVILHPRQSNMYQRAWKIFFISLIGVFLGSAYYHLQPNLNRLFIDRLALIFSMMSLFSLLAIERVPYSLKRFIFPLLMILGLGSVIYWWLAERLGFGDVRFYLLVQYYAMLAIPLICILYPKKGDCYVYISVALYAIAKIFEIKDFKIFALTHEYLSGHTLKHLVCAVGAYFIHLKSVTTYNR